MLTVTTENVRRSFDLMVQFNQERYERLLRAYKLIEKDEEK